MTVQGKLKQQAWKDKDGNNRKRIYVRAQRVRIPKRKKAKRAKMEPHNTKNLVAAIVWTVMLLLMVIRHSNFFGKGVY